MKIYFIKNIISVPHEETVIEDVENIKDAEDVDKADSAEGVANTDSVAGEKTSSMSKTDLQI